MSSRDERISRVLRLLENARRNEHPPKPVITVYYLPEKPMLVATPEPWRRERDGRS